MLLGPVPGQQPSPGKNKTKAFTCFYRWFQVIVPKWEGRTFSGLTVSRSRDSETGLGGLGREVSQEELGMSGTRFFTWKSLTIAKTE